MPTEFKGAVKVDAFALEERQDLAARIGVISSLWAQIEDELALIFAYALNTMPAIATATLGNVFSVPTKLNMLHTALELRFPEDVVAPFLKLKKRTRTTAKTRAWVIHAAWTIHADHPNALIRCAGITDPRLGMLIYTRRDFVEIEMQLLQLHIDLRKYGQSLATSRELTVEERMQKYWSLTGLQPPSDATSDQTGQDED